MTKILRDGFDPKDARFDEGSSAAAALPTFVLDPAFRAAMIERIVARIEQEQGSQVAGQARTAMLHMAEEDEVRWRAYLAARQEKQAAALDAWRAQAGPPDPEAERWARRVFGIEEG